MTIPVAKKVQHRFVPDLNMQKLHCHVGFCCTILICALSLCPRWQSYWLIPKCFLLLCPSVHPEGVFIPLWSGCIQHALGCTAAIPFQQLLPGRTPCCYWIFEVYFAGSVKQTGSRGLTQALAQHVARPRMCLPALRVSSQSKIAPSTTLG